MNLKKLAAILFLVLLAACADKKQIQTDVDLSQQDSAGIVGGSEVTKGTISQVTVALVIKTASGTALCTGTLISSHVVLTAAHCVDGAQAIVVNFSRDAKDFAKDKQNYRRVSNIFANPLYRPGSAKNWGDLALVKFVGEAPVGYKTVQLLKSGASLRANQSLTLAGYGATSMQSGETQGTSILRAATVKLTDPLYAQTELLIEQTADGKGACHGDSGGPAFAQINGQLVQVGVTSRSATEAGGLTCQSGSIYTNVAAQAGFIEKTIARLEALPAPAATVVAKK